MSPREWKKPQLSLFAGLVLALVILLICLVYSVTLGAAEISLDKVLTSFIAFDGSYDHLVIQTVRLPRSLIAILVGGERFFSGEMGKN
ncbi:iron chelate uptake ABC transporter family permease subunit [Nostoc sp. DedQUE12b]|uniref:iron chelate uptake ABC transporter family permease subunit n=1 Tax=Nostoc sp. DedQUE12b TaxID=3075398 RepID=UPI003A1030E5